MSADSDGDPPVGMDRYDGILPFDPRLYGPRDAISDLTAWVRLRDREILATVAVGVIALIAIHARYGIEIEIPNALPVFASALGIAALASIPITRKVIEMLWGEDHVSLVVLDAADGEIGVVDLSPARFKNMRVVDHAGDRKDSSFLREIQTWGGGRAFECDRYDPDQNIAVCSWMAGATNRDIRRHKHAVKYLKKELSREADKSLDILINAPEIIREQGSVAINDMIREAEGVTTPGEENSELYERMYDRTEAVDKSEDLLDDRGIDHDSIEEAIREFAEERGLDPDEDPDQLLASANGHSDQEVSADE
jgi:hypothetical protein